MQKEMRSEIEEIIIRTLLTISPSFINAKAIEQINKENKDGRINLKHFILAASTIEII